MSPAPPAQRDKNGATFVVGKQSYADSQGKCTHNMERDRIGMWGSGDTTASSQVSGLDRLRHPGLNKVCYSISFLKTEIDDRVFSVRSWFRTGGIVQFLRQIVLLYVHWPSLYRALGVREVNVGVSAVSTHIRRAIVM